MAVMILPGVYPAAVTPLTPDDRLDEPSLARLLAWFQAQNCAGVVVAGTNGEGPSLSAVEKRDLVRAAVGLSGGLPIIAGIATASLHEATWLASQAEKAGAAALLVMPPAYFRTAPVSGITAWYEALTQATKIPVLAYNYPKMTGIPLNPEMLADLFQRGVIAGAKDSSGERENLRSYRDAFGSDGVLFVGDETLLGPALAAGWTGTISGAANLIPSYLARIVAEPESREALIGLIEPVLQVIRAQSQPASNKAVLHALGIIDAAFARLPLQPVDPTPVLEVLTSRLGVRPGNLPV